MLKHSQRILFLLLSLSLVCLSCFSSLTINAFAEEAEADSYNIDCVPYSPYISNLTVKDNETQVVMRSTYALSAASATSDTSTDYVYSYSNIADLFLYRSVNSAVSHEFLSDGSFQINSVSDTLTSTKIVFTSRNLTNLKVGNKYSFSFRISFDRGYHSGNMIVRLYDSSDSSKYLDLYSSSGSLKVDKNISATLVIPDDWAGVPVLKMEINWTGISTYFPIKIGLQDFVMTDTTNENLDKSLGKLGDRIEGFFDNLADKIKGFFIPSEGFFETVQEQFQTLLSEHLGFLYEAPALVTDLFQVISDFEPSEVSYITLPEVDFDIAGTHVHLWDEQVYYFDFLDQQPFSIIYGFYKTLVFVIISIAMINLAINKYHNIIDGGSGDDN